MIRAFLARWRCGYYRRCLHRSHRLGLACWRSQTYDHQCGKHNGTCFNTCVRPYLTPAIEQRRRAIRRALRDAFKETP